MRVRVVRPGSSTTRGATLHHRPVACRSCCVVCRSVCSFSSAMSAGAELFFLVSPTRLPGREYEKFEPF